MNYLRTRICLSAIGFFIPLILFGLSVALFETRFEKIGALPFYLWSWLGPASVFRVLTGGSSIHLVLPSFLWAWIGFTVVDFKSPSERELNPAVRTNRLALTIVATVIFALSAILFLGVAF